ncbi:MAG: hypothetical protein C0501_24365 [Isosphaera sp.]|nr:hypothetical protein [Isosphaera sp.]
MTGNAPGRTDRQRIWFAQALRPAACLAVIACHYFILFVTDPQAVAGLALFPPLTDLPRPGYVGPAEYVTNELRLGGGMFAVDLLFLVSGFVIPFSLRSGSLGGFFARRFFRLYPTFWVVLGSVFAVVGLNALAFGLANPLLDWKVVVGNGLLCNPYLGKPFVEAVCWTLVIEELFYVVCAVLAWRGGLGRPGVLLLAAAGLAACSVGWAAVRPDPLTNRWQNVPNALAHNCTHVGYVFIGVVLHHLYTGAWRLRVGLPVLVAQVGLYWAACNHGMATSTAADPGYFWHGVNALAVFSAAMLANRRLPYSAWWDRLAELSYPLYLVHATLGYVVIRAVYLGTGSLYLGFAAAFAGAVGLAAVLHRFVEKPSMEYGRRLARGRPTPPAARVEPVSAPRAAA